MKFPTLLLRLDTYRNDFINRKDNDVKNIKKTYLVKIVKMLI
jgi:hypothetical protein